jgi:hypothetical protein
MIPGRSTAVPSTWSSTAVYFNWIGEDVVVLTNAIEEGNMCKLPVLYL